MTEPNVQESVTAETVERVARAASGETTWRWERGVTSAEKMYWRSVARRVICELEEASA